MRAVTGVGSCATRSAGSATVTKLLQAMRQVCEYQYEVQMPSEITLLHRVWKRVDCAQSLKDTARKLPFSFERNSVQS